MNCKLALTLITIILTNFGCQGKLLNKNQKKSDDVAVTKVTTIYGDPEQLILGRDLNHTFIHKDDIENFEDFSLSGISILTELPFEFGKEDSASKNLVQRALSLNTFEEKNSTSEQDLGEISRFFFIKTRDGYDYQNEEETAKGNQVPLIHFSEGPSGNLTISHLLGVKVTELHYSMSEDKNTFSILIRVPEAKDKYGKALATIVFTKNFGSYISPKILDAYHYIFGDGVAVALKKDKVLKLSSCGSQSEKGEIVLEKALLNWIKNAPGSSFDPVTQKGNLFNLKIEIVKNANVPFSDLSVTCIDFLDQYRLPYTSEGDVLGITYPFRNVTKQDIVANFALISGRRGEKSQSIAQNEKILVHIVTHELGHVLGLGHVFDGSDPESIMSYNKVTRVTETDLDSLKALYDND